MPEQNGAQQGRSLLFAWSPHGYQLHELPGEVPAIGSAIEHGGRRLVVVKIGASPLPGDGRRCAYALEAPGGLSS